MSKLVKFIHYLRNHRGRKIKTKELMNELGVKNIKSIMIYKNQSIELGYPVKSYGGYVGGYVMEEEYLTEDDVTTIRLNLPEKLANKIIEIDKRV